MTGIFKWALAVAAAVIASQASAQITFYENDNFTGRTFTAQDAIDNFQRVGFNDRASSVVVQGGPWEVCDDAGFRGRCIVLRPGNYPSLRAMNMNDRLSSARMIDPSRLNDPSRFAPQPLPPQITFYEDDGFRGPVFSANNDIGNLRQFGFNDRASSVVVLGDRWEVCDRPGFGGQCVVLRPGRYPSLASMGMNDRVSSVRLVAAGQRYDDSRYAPPPAPVYDPRRRPEEHFFDANVTSVHAVFAQPQQHCWVEQQQVVTDQPTRNVGGAVVGGVLGGILGHQIGGGNGRNVATVGGALAGAAIGANAGRQDQQVVTTQDVQRCAATPAQGRPDYFDVSYVFRGLEHHVQMTNPPGATVTVNDAGEPRV